METLSQLQKRLSSSRDGNRSFDIMRFMDLAEYFSDLFRESDCASFIGTPAEFRAVLDKLLVIAQLLGIDADVAVRRKYRNKCSRCLRKPCLCWDILPEHKPLYYRPQRIRARQRTIEQLQHMLAEVFPHRHTLEQEVQRVRDEIAELAEAFFHKKKADQEEEIADVFAWLARVASTLGIPLEGFVG